MQLWSMKRNNTVRRALPNLGETINIRTPVIETSKTKQTAMVIVTQRKQIRAKAKNNTISTTAQHTKKSTRTTSVVVMRKTRIGISQWELQNGTSHNTKRLASRSAGGPRHNDTTSTICSATAQTILSTQSRIPAIFLLLTAMLLHVSPNDVQAYESTVRKAGTSGRQSVIISSHHRATRAAQYSPLLSTDGQWVDNADNNSFRPIIPKGISPEYIAQNVFTETGQYRVFQPTASDLRMEITKEQTAKNIANVEDNDKMSMAKINTDIVRDINQSTKKRTQIIQKHAKDEDVDETFASRREETIDKTKRPGERVIKVAKTQKLTKSIEALPNSLKFGQPAEQQTKLLNSTSQPTSADASQNIVTDDIKELEALLVEYAESFFNKAQYEPSSKLVDALQRNRTTEGNLLLAGGEHKNRAARHASANPHHHHHHHLHHHRYNDGLAGITRKADGDVSVNIPRAMQSGRLLFFTGLKKVLWPVFMGLQVFKSLLFALFLPTLIGSFGKLLGKGIVSGSAPIFIRPPDAPQDLDFRDNTINFDDDKFAVIDEGTKEDGYAYNQAEASQTHYTYNAADIHRVEQQNKMPDTYLSALQTIGSASFKNSGSLSGSSSGGGLGGGLGGLGAPTKPIAPANTNTFQTFQKVPASSPASSKPIAPANTNTFQTFQKVPASSLFLSNYDPFYSPLLSRLDSVFAQLKLNSDNENCREKLICLMYANPAKYAPYSNLVSAQLSRELNELRKPTSDNPDILRFFKYMRAAKDGQDGADCEKSFDSCKEFKDFENPAMVSTYHDINKLVQARKLT